jgi:hypothetical protein
MGGLLGTFFTIIWFQFYPIWPNNTPIDFYKLPNGVYEVNNRQVQGVWVKEGNYSTWLWVDSMPTTMTGTFQVMNGYTYKVEELKP